MRWQCTKSEGPQDECTKYGRRRTSFFFGRRLNRSVGTTTWHVEQASSPPHAPSISTSCATAVSNTVLPTTPETTTLLPVVLSMKANVTRGSSFAGGVGGRTAEDDEDDAAAAATAEITPRWVAVPVVAIRRVNTSIVVKLRKRCRRHAVYCCSRTVWSSVQDSYPSGAERFWKIGARYEFR